MQDSTIKTILITGGCGFIGTNLVRRLSSTGYKIRILDNLSASKKENLSAAGCQLSSIDLIIADIRDQAAVNQTVEGSDAVVHLAAHTSVVESLEKPQESWDINVNGTVNLLESCRLKGVNVFIMASSNAVLGEQPPPADETKIPKPLSPYGASKMADEALCSSYHHSFGLNTVSLRFSNCYGPYSEHKTSVIAKFLDLARAGKPIIIYGDGYQTRDFVHVDDICQAIQLCLLAVFRQHPTIDHQEITANPIFGEVFQIASGVETSINELTEMLKEITEQNPAIPGHQLVIKYKPKRKGEIQRNYSDITKAKKTLGFKPTVKLKDGLLDLWGRYV